jgi:hypothetical protein
MISRSSRWVAAALACALLLGSCSKRRDPIVIEDGTLVVQNQTSRDWRNVLVTVNDHFRGGTSSLAAGSRMSAPLFKFQTAFGQSFDRSRQSVFKVEVTATDADGQPVRLTWGGDKKP